jgi:hypothetical protein
MKKSIQITLLSVLAAIIILATRCTQNQVARQLGGKETIALDKGVRLVNITWKGKNGSDLWMLTKIDTTVPTTYQFSERSNFGILNGEITIIEH